MKRGGKFSVREKNVLQNLALQFSTQLWRWRYTSYLKGHPHFGHFLQAQKLGMSLVIFQP